MLSDADVLTIPSRYDQFDKIYKLVGVPVVTVQLRYDGWVTEMQDEKKRVTVGESVRRPHVCLR